MDRMKARFIKGTLIVLLAVIAAAAVTGCSFGKKEASAEDFISVASQSDFDFRQETDYFSQYDYVKDVYVAAPEDRGFRIEFYVLSGEAEAKSFYETNKSTFVMMRGDRFVDEESSGSNYSIYKLESYGKFMMVERVGKTVVFVNSTDSANREAIESFIKKLGY